jgi:hypothetical protein
LHAFQRPGISNLGLKLQFSYRKYNHRGLCCQVKSPESNLANQFIEQRVDWLMPRDGLQACDLSWTPGLYAKPANLTARQLEPAHQLFSSEPKLFWSWPHSAFCGPVFWCASFVIRLNLPPNPRNDGLRNCI